MKSLYIFRSGTWRLTVGAFAPTIGNFLFWHLIFMTPRIKIDEVCLIFFLSLIFDLPGLILVNEGVVKGRDKAIIYSSFVKSVFIKSILQLFMKDSGKLVSIVLRSHSKISGSLDFDIYQHFSIKCLKYFIKGGDVDILWTCLKVWKLLWFKNHFKVLIILGLGEMISCFLESHVKDVRDIILILADLGWHLSFHASMNDS